MLTRKRFQHAGRRYDEEVDVERIPLDFAQRAHRAFQALAADVIDEPIAHVDPERLRNPLLDRK